MASVFTDITLIVLAFIEASGLQPCEVGLDSCVSSFGVSCCLLMYLLSECAAARTHFLSHRQCFSWCDGASRYQLVAEAAKPTTGVRLCGWHYGSSLDTDGFAAALCLSYYVPSRVSYRQLDERLRLNVHGDASHGGPLLDCASRLCLQQSRALASLLSGTGVTRWQESQVAHRR
ncbi:hypothetical protein, conserved [Leishmania donovani]|uniref:Uncharacterized protein n=1 Tax=Leishmania donovani TaxID=5661 RepID=E9BQG3_LEIDO|nr:hypothetical protein, conserved [Leishmania donovani]CBZ37492.1 hypothetical protein, conserved [Leishmania donovani]